MHLRFITCLCMRSCLFVYPTLFSPCVLRRYSPANVHILLWFNWSSSCSVLHEAHMKTLSLSKSLLSHITGRYVANTVGLYSYQFSVYTFCLLAVCGHYYPDGMKEAFWMYPSVHTQHIYKMPRAHCPSSIIWMKANFCAWHSLVLQWVSNHQWSNVYDLALLGSAGLWCT